MMLMMMVVTVGVVHVGCHLVVLGAKGDDD
jgi:hypothetical protein